MSSLVQSFQVSSSCSNSQKTNCDGTDGTQLGVILKREYLGLVEAKVSNCLSLEAAPTLDWENHYLIHEGVTSVDWVKQEF
jgi:hypothetical protein